MKREELFLKLLELESLAHWVRSKLVETYRNVPVESLELTTLALNAIKAGGVQTVAELTDLSESELRKLPNIGRKSLIEIKEVLAVCGLRLH